MSFFGALRKRTGKAVDAFKRKIHVPVFTEEAIAPDRKTQLEEQIAAAKLMEATTQTEGYKLIEQEQVKNLNSAMAGLMEAKCMEDVRALQAECLALRREMNRIPQALVLAEANAIELSQIKKDEEDNGEEEDGH